MSGGSRCGLCAAHINHEGTCDRYPPDQSVSLIDDEYSPIGGGCNSYSRAEDTLPLTDWGNARRFTSEYGDRLLYCPEMKSWYVWDGTVWCLDTVGSIFQFGKKVIGELYDLIAGISDPDQKKRLLKFIISSENQGRLKAMEESARNEPGIPISINEFDMHKDLINVSNGVLNLKSGELSPHDKSLKMTKKMSFDYEFDAECPQWEMFLDQICPDEDIQRFLQRWFGYSLTGHTSEQVFCILYGHGANGKGTMIDTIMAIMEGYAKTTEPETIIKRKYERSSTNDLADLKGSRFVTTSENESYQELDEGRIKRITGQDKLKCRFLYREYFEYIPEFKLVLLTNHEPIIKAHDYSIWRRVLKIPFDVTIPKEEWDLSLRDKLLAEKEGILRWLVDGAIEWYEKGLDVPDVIKTATEEYKGEMDIIGDFIVLCTEQDINGQVFNGELYEVYTYWCTASKQRPYSQNSFPRTLNERGFKTIKHCGVRAKTGLKIKESLKNDLDAAKYIEDEKTLARTIGTIFSLFLESPHEKESSKTFQKLNIYRPENTTDSDFEKINRPCTRFSQEQVSRMLKIIKIDWYGTDKPQDPASVKEHFERELITACKKSNFDLSQESAKRYVEDFYVVSGWSYGVSQSQRDRNKAIRDIIREIQQGNGNNTAGYSEIVAASKAQGIEDPETIIKRLKGNGSICEAKTGLYQVV